MQDSMIVNNDNIARSRPVVQLTAWIVQRRGEPAAPAVVHVEDVSIDIRREVESG
jgi:hypothetical protein